MNVSRTCLITCQSLPVCSAGVGECIARAFAETRVKNKQKPHTYMVLPWGEKDTNFQKNVRNSDYLCFMWDIIRFCYGLIHLVWSNTVVCSSGASLGTGRAVFVLISPEFHPTLLKL